MFEDKIRTHEYGVLAQPPLVLMRCLNNVHMCLSSIPITSGWRNTSIERCEPVRVLSDIRADFSPHFACWFLDETLKYKRAYDTLGAVACAISLNLT